MLLSILILSLNEREHFLKTLLDNLNFQIKQNNYEDLVKIDTFVDNRQYLIGYKRNVLLQRTESEYVAFIDDDDRISNNYIKIIIESLKTKPDCLSLKGEITFNGKNQKIFIHSNKYNRYYEENNIYYRYPNHLNVIKTSIAKQFVFPEKNHGEDTAWATLIYNSGLLKNEIEINDIIYFYDFITNKTKTNEK